MTNRIKEWFGNPAKLLITFLSTIPLVYLLLFVIAYGSRVPIIDDTSGLLAPVAVTAKAGTLTVGDLFQVWHGHRNFFSLLTTTLITVTTDGNIRYELALLILLGCVNVGLLLVLFARTEPHILHWVMLPFSAFMLTTQLGIIWLSPVYTTWHYNLMFTLLGILSLLTFKPGLPTLLIASLCCICAMLSLAGGIVSWSAILLLMLLTRDYRRIRYFVIVLIIMTAAIWLYTRDSGIAIAENASPSTLTIPQINFLDLIVYFFTLLGSPIAFEHVTLSAYTGIGGVTLFVANSVYLTLTGKLPQIRGWLALAVFTFAMSALISLTRAQFSIGVAVHERYSHLATQLWIINIALIATVIYTAREKYNWKHKLILNVNVLVIAPITGLFMYTSFSMTNTLQGNITVTDHMALIHCYEQYPLRNHNCEGFSSEIHDLLAAYNMGGYQNLPKSTTIIDYQPADHAIIHTDDLWYSVHLRNAQLENLTSDNILHMLPEIPSPPNEHLALLPKPVEHLAATHSPDAEQFVEEANALWLLQRGITQPLEPITQETTFIQEFALMEHFRADENIDVSKYLRLPADTLGVPIIFGGFANLIAWQINTTTVSACDTATITTYWQSTQSVTDVHNLTVTLIDEQGIGIVRNDGPTGVSIEHWQPDNYYADQRTLEIPCDFDNGDYPVLMGIYPLETVELVEVAFASGEPLEPLLYLTTLSVE